jgi:hypothetical protein
MDFFITHPHKLIIQQGWTPPATGKPEIVKSVLDVSQVPGREFYKS